jgi:hypothetical protein
LSAKAHQPTGIHTKGRSELTRDEEEAGLELLEEHHSLAHEAPSEQDQHRPGGDGGPAQTNVRFGSNLHTNEHEHHEGCQLQGGDGAPEFGRLRLAGAGNAGLDIVGRVELGLRGGDELPGLGEGATVLGLDGPQPPAVVRVRPRRPLDSLRQLRRRRHWIGAVRGAASARGLGAAAGEEWRRGFGRVIYMCAAAWRWKP